MEVSDFKFHYDLEINTAEAEVVLPVFAQFDQRVVFDLEMEVFEDLAVSPFFNEDEGGNQNDLNDFDGYCEDLDLGEDEFASEDDGRSSLREREQQILRLFLGLSKSRGSRHENAFQHLLRNAKQYEAAVCVVLESEIQALIEKALVSPNANDARTLINRYALDRQDAASRLLSFCGLAIFDEGPSDHGFLALDFNCGWDEEHGLSVLMHMGKVLTVGAIGDFEDRAGELSNFVKKL